jgi:glycosyltransferase involved in cell wall biosynthesis
MKPAYGGPAFSEAMLCTALQKRASVTVLVRADRVDREFVSEHGLHDVVTYSPTDLLRKVPALFANFDVFHLNGHWRWEYAVLARLSERAGVPYVLHPRGMLLVGHRKVFAKKWFNRLLGNHIVERASRVIALSEFETLQFDPYGVLAEKVTVLANPITTPQISALETSKKSGFLYLGRIEQRKNLIFLVEAFKEYRDKGGTSELRMVGPVERGYDEMIRQAVALLGLDESVKVLPPAFGDEKWRAIQRAEALIYPALEEPFGRVPFEALTVGTAPVVPDRSGSAEYLKPFLPQCIYRENDRGSLVNTLLNVNAPLTFEGVDRARGWIQTALHPDHIAERMLEIYTGLRESPASLTETLSHAR